MAIRRESVAIVKKLGGGVLEKYKANIGKREDFVEFTVRGIKAQKIAEIAEVVKWLSVNDATKSFQIPQQEFERAYGPGAKGVNYVKGYLKKFGIPQPRIAPSQDIVHIWSKSPIK